MNNQERHYRVSSEVTEERIRQDKKWGEQNHNDSRWSHILGEEYGEAMEGVNVLTFDPDTVMWDERTSTINHLREELIQVAAVAVAWVECIDRRKEMTFGALEGNVHGS